MHICVSLCTVKIKIYSYTHHAYVCTVLTHWGRVMHICVSELTIIGSDNGLSPGRRQAIIWTNAGTLLIRTLGTNFSEILGKINSFSFKKMHLKMLSAKWRLFSLGLNELRTLYRNDHLFLGIPQIIRCFCVGYRFLSDTRPETVCRTRYVPNICWLYGSGYCSTVKHCDNPAWLQFLHGTGMKMDVSHFIISDHNYSICTLLGRV